MGGHAGPGAVGHFVPHWLKCQFAPPGPPGPPNRLQKDDKSNTCLAQPFTSHRISTLQRASRTVRGAVPWRRSSRRPSRAFLRRWCLAELRPPYDQRHEGPFEKPLGSPEVSSAIVVAIVGRGGGDFGGGFYCVGGGCRVACCIVWSIAHEVRTAQGMEINLAPDV